MPAKQLSRWILAGSVTSLLLFSAQSAWSFTGKSLVQGQVVNEKIIHAAVAAYGVETSGYLSRTPLATSETNSEGRFAIKIPAHYTGPLQLTVYKHPDKLTLSTCTARKFCGAFEQTNDGTSNNDFNPLDTNKNKLIDFGEHFAVNSHYKISATLPHIESGERINVYITPLTDMASQISDSVGRKNSKLVVHANRWVAKQFHLGFGILGTQPVDLVGSVRPPSSVNQHYSNRLKYALLSAAFTEYGVTHYAGDTQAARLECGWNFSVAFLKKPIAVKMDSDSMPNCYLNIVKAAAQIGDELPNLLNGAAARSLRHASASIAETFGKQAFNATPPIKPAALQSSLKHD